jgi:hypothetical protein
MTKLIMTDTPLAANDGVATICERCGMRMRLVGSEPHMTLDRTDLRTFECQRCDWVQTICVNIGAASRSNNGPAAD